MTSKTIFGIENTQDDTDDFDSITHNEADLDDYVVSDQNVEEKDTQSRKIKNNAFTYPALQDLKQDISDMSLDIETITFLVYKVNTDGKYPFLEFGMAFSSETHLYHFMECEKSYIWNTLKGLKHVDGYIVRETKAYVFYQVDNSVELTTMMKTFFPDVHFLLADELVNGKQVMKCKIHQDVTAFFKMHPHFLFLHSTTNDVFEMPVVLYHGTKNKNIKFISYLGTSPSEISAPFGVGYYFTDFENAKRRALRTSIAYINPSFNSQHNNVMEKGIVCRFAIFPGKMKVLLNKPDDGIDESSTKQQLLSSPHTFQKAKMTMRLTDHDGRWKDNYDSVYIGKSDLDDGTRFEEGPLWCLKDYEQQLFLTYQLC
jgi:hypothetical protein